MLHRFVSSVPLVALAVSTVCALSAAEAPNPELERQFGETVRPFVQQHCVVCHGGETPASQFNIEVYSTFQTVIDDHPHWALILGRLRAGEMPPEGIPQPPAEARQRVIDWIEAVRTDEAQRRAGDPGPVLARRLSNSEYNYTIRDLTGADLRPAREFPIDPANLAGFDNSGESLTMSPSLLNKYLQAAREVAEHMAFTPDGFDFAPHPMLVETDRDKYTIQRIIDFYERQPTDFADYFEAAWRYKHRAALGKPNASLADAAAESKVSATYLPKIWELIEEPPKAAKQEAGPIAKLQAMWRELPAPSANQPDELRQRCVEMREFVVRIRRHTGMQFAAPVVDGLPGASQPLLNWKLAKFNAHRRDFDPASLRNDTDPPPEVPEVPRYPGLHREAAGRWAALIANERATNLDLVVPAAERERYEASFRRFASVFPDGFFVKERGRFFPDDSNDKGRFLSAGYHNVMGYYRDDTALMELVLDEEGRKQLNRLWDEFDFIAAYTERTWIQFFDNASGAVRGTGAESGTLRPEDHAVTSPTVIFGLRDEYLAKAREDPANDPLAQEAILDHFQKVNDTLRRLEKMHLDAQPLHVDALLEFAERAYRRPLTKPEGDNLRGYYRSLRENGGLSHEEAMRDSIVTVLMSPHFLYRIDLVDGFVARAGAGNTPRVVAASTSAAAKPAPAVDASALSPYALANRLSYFLWSSMPDEELLARAADGSLRRPDVLAAQTRRMLNDPRIRGLATEFTGNWLEFRRFEQHNAVDRERFPAFDDALRQAMFEEPIRFIENALRNDRPVLDLIYGDYTFVNPVLARHYGIPEAAAGNETVWVRLDDAGRFDRGGLLAMAVFLTQSSPGLRTSPVKRGYWIVHRVLGERIPPPPPVVPELPSDEGASELPLPEMLARHRANPVCASCHARFDSFGLAFEGYGPVGESRSNDLAGRLIEAIAEFPGGGEGEGLKGVRDYIREHRQDDFVDNLSRKMLAYALSRTLLLSDEPLLEEAKANLTNKDFRFGSLIETIVTSPQFLNRRGSDPAEQRASAATRGE